MLALPELIEKLEWMGARQVGVYQHQIGCGIGDGFEDVRAACRMVDGVAFLFQQLLQRTGTSFVVIDDYDVPTIGQSGPSS